VTQISYFRNKILTKNIISVPITTLGFASFISLIGEWAQQRKSKYVCVANVHMLIEAYQQPEFYNILQNADLVTPDGMPLVWMLKIFGVRKPSRIAGMDILLALCQHSAENEISLFFVGSTDKVLHKIRSRIEVEFPNVTIAGMESPPFKSRIESKNHSLADRINKSEANIIFVALGCPKQEQWMAMHKGDIKGVMIGLGAAFEVFAGEKEWAPVWIRKAGLEWLFRLIQEPRRLWKRYLYTNSFFIYLIIKQFLLHKFSKKKDS
jgi:N-acetylglucosaminyldiphosphoundecaprenol N-acetyl-beta-D-mannosaminyltransferase